MNESSSHKHVPAEPADSSVRSRPSSASPGNPPSSSSRALFPDDQRTIISSRPPAAQLDFQGQPLFESASLWEGEQLGQFLLQKFVGGGGMGIVFRALDTTLDREVAVKVLSRDQSADEETLRRFRNEAQSAARLNHENIARVFYVGEDRGVHYIVFEFIEGENIRDLVDQQGPLPLEQAISYTYQIAQALEHASQRAVIHRDIKPSNVLITPDGQAKLVDMGLARLNRMAPAAGDLTASGITLGTFDYISPEQARDPRSADVRSDLYSLGCSFYFMLTGRPPFPDGTVLQKLLQHQADSPPEPRTLRPELPGEISRILARLLAKDPAERYQQPAELINALAGLGRALGMQLAGAHSVRIAPRPSKLWDRWLPHLPWIVPLAALFAIVLGLDIYWSRGAEQTAGIPFELPSAEVQTRPAPPRDTRPESLVQPIDDREPTEADRPMLEPDGDAEANGQVPTPDDSTGDTNQVESILREFRGLGSTIFEEFQRQRQASAVPSDPDAPLDIDANRTAPARDQDAARPMPPGNRIANGQNVLTVGDPAAPRNYSSLQAACSAASDGDTIELRYDGVKVEQPIAISNIKLSLRAGLGYEPVVVFEPGAFRASRYDDAMFSIVGGQLSASGIHWEFSLLWNFPRGAPGALFETVRADLLEFQDCTFTVRGQQGYQSGVAFFDVKAPPGDHSMSMDTGMMDHHVVDIRLQSCVARGEATLLRDDDVQSVRLTWDNGLLATGERLFTAEGASLRPRHENRAELTLKHVTMMVAGGLVLLTNSIDAPYQLTTEIQCADCIIATPGGPPLVDQRGSDRIDDYQRRFRWSGERNYFSGFDIFWRIVNAAGQTGSKQLDFAGWQEHWKDHSLLEAAGPGAVVWASLPEGSRSRAYHTHVPADYVLAEQSAASGASEGFDAGSVALYLPIPPDENRSLPLDPRSPRESEEQ